MSGRGETEKLFDFVVDDQLNPNDPDDVKQPRFNSSEKSRRSSALVDDVCDSSKNPAFRRSGFEVLREDGIARMREDARDDGGGKGGDDRGEGVDFFESLGGENGDKGGVDEFAHKIEGHLFAHGVRDLFRDHGRKGVEGSERAVLLDPLDQSGSCAWRIRRFRDETYAHVFGGTQDDTCRSSGDDRREQEVDDGRIGEVGEDGLAQLVQSELDCSLDAVPDAGRQESRQ